MSCKNDHYLTILGMLRILEMVEIRNYPKSPFLKIAAGFFVYNAGSFNYFRWMAFEGELSSISSKKKRGSPTSFLLAQEIIVFVTKLLF